MRPFEWQSATSATLAAAQATHTAAQAMLGANGAPAEAQAILIKAGGVDVLDLLKGELIHPLRLLDIGGLAELQGITGAGDGGTRIGALTTLAQLARHAEVARAYPALAQAAGQAASPQVRNRATLGGNLLQRPRCWYLRSAAHHCTRKGGAHCFAYTGDHRYHAVFANHGCAIVHPSTPATALLAYGASVELLDDKGGRRAIALEDFFLLPQADMHRENLLERGEILTTVWLPATTPGSRSIYLQVGERAAFDWPLAAVAAVLDLGPDGRCRDARLVLGAAAPIPWRARAAEALLAGRKLDETVAAAAGEAALEGASPLPGNAYKLKLLRALVRRALLALAGVGESAGLT